MNHFFRRREKKKASRRETLHQKHFEQTIMTVSNQPLSSNLRENVELISNELGQAVDLVTRYFLIGPVDEQRQAAVMYIDSLVREEQISDFIIEYLATPDMDRDEPAIYQLDKAVNIREAVMNLLSGNTIMLINGNPTGFVNTTRGLEKRGVEEPRTEAVIRGPRDGFTENISTNMGLIRSRLKDPNLRLKHVVIGARTQTDIFVMYIDGVANQSIVDEVMLRLSKIDVDSILESGYIEQIIEDRKWSPFPQLQNTERPDKAVANLLEGKVLILINNTPFVLIAPAIFTQFYQSPEDYYERYHISTFIRSIRLIGLLAALLLPSLYIAFSSFHPEMIPSRLINAMTAGRSTVPFPAIVEAFIMEITIEVLREASVRLPGPIGPTIGIVGALVVGEAAVTAGLVSPIMVIIVALTTIGSFTSPSYSSSIAIRILRFPMMVFAGMFGLYGIMLFLILIITHLSSLKSFGIPYMSPLSPMKLLDMRDLLLRAPFFMMKNRPRSYEPADLQRQKKDGNK